MTIACGCSDTSDTELTVYLLEEKVIAGEKKVTISALKPRKFKIWKNAKVVYQEAFLNHVSLLNDFTKMGIFYKDCIIEDKNNWCCYDSKKSYSNVYEYHLESTRYVVENDWARDKNLEELVCYCGVFNGKWMLQVKYHEKNDDALRSRIYSVPYWKWLLYEKKILSNKQLL
ncbi:MAG TPA: hypothetical protein PK583_00905 [Gammaproteobacteria bacterium]|nr:hypothetical protein [Gammaproteobacteria bacterium]HRA42866.1 hypothetical protein [Gammaproteobacteria bacterium]